VDTIFKTLQVKAIVASVHLQIYLCVLKYTNTCPKADEPADATPEDDAEFPMADRCRMIFRGN
jgi:hypothetical protein